ncbi:D-glycero-beta-D-manno-heptose 1-phosphate adenylyltransferase [Candidatus Synechococcus calcipolaris G9]|uniref:D-glycero-beta-D-manno-heptose 1-phosphate adenylyltransferase n=1 Tax=Candidatus Synechococcus calcipolaris G9 TaxID=1497997 RepID=A0ABT6EZD7_9SYNE|nr:D-glycero-beta-D-manno-heptose 1-phosphate adenylyltransferase [Candidatus Synechococcus calcipolaris]MDG2990936.1 D-glycero-beta-D-manno-heptose 1-phosphate adenylyltransferase [Candidatus Synechococcus calcipolaris G9]
MVSGVYSLAELQQLLQTSPELWRPMVFTNGCFDLLHAGHVRYLQRARQLGQSLVVGLNSDRSVAEIKPHRLGQPPRPIVPQEQRAEVLAALKSVDGVVIFDDPTAKTLIESLQPDIYVKGGDYQLNTLPEASVVKSYGGKIELIQVEIPSSTTAMINRIIQFQGG